jgi:hypothetical protein
MGKAKNQKTKKHRCDDQRRMQEHSEIGGTMALLWNMLRKSLPSIMISDYDEVLAGLDLPRMETGLGDEYEVELYDGRYRFTTGDLAPPTAIVAWNYARYEQSWRVLRIKANSHVQADTCRQQRQRLHGLIHLRKQRGSSFRRQFLPGKVSHLGGAGS